MDKDNNNIIQFPTNRHSIKSPKSNNSKSNKGNAPIYSFFNTDESKRGNTPTIKEYFIKEYLETVYIKKDCSISLEVLLKYVDYNNSKVSICYNPNNLINTLLMLNDKYTYKNTIKDIEGVYSKGSLKNPYITKAIKSNNINDKCTHINIISLLFNNTNFNTSMEDEIKEVTNLFYLNSFKYLLITNCINEVELEIVFNKSKRIKPIKTTINLKEGEEYEK